MSILNKFVLGDATIPQSVVKTIDVSHSQS